MIEAEAAAPLVNLSEVAEIELFILKRMKIGRASCRERV